MVFIKRNKILLSLEENVKRVANEGVAVNSYLFILCIVLIGRFYKMIHNVRWLFRDLITLTITEFLSRYGCVSIPQREPDGYMKIECVRKVKTLKVAVFSCFMANRLRWLACYAASAFDEKLKKMTIIKTPFSVSSENQCRISYVA